MVTIREMLLEILDVYSERGEIGSKIQAIIDTLSIYGDGMQNPFKKEALKKAEAHVFVQQIVDVRGSIFCIFSMMLDLAIVKGFADLQVLSPYDSDTMKAIKEEDAIVAEQKERMGTGKLRTAG